MSDLHERLDAAFAAVDPGAAPVDAAMRAGSRIRSSRRAGLLAGAVAVVVAAVVAIPAITREQAAPSPVTSHVKVTVNPPGPHSPAGLIAFGLIGSTPWNISVQSPKSKDCLVQGADLSFIACNGSLGQPDAADPISLAGEGQDGGQGAVGANVSFGEVRKDVVSARVTLSDGTMLTLHPVAVDGIRFVAFAVPVHMAVDSLTAYSRAGEIAIAIPFTGPSGLPLFGGWLRPGQARPPVYTGTFGSGTVLTAHLGPWGTCLDLGGGESDCVPQAAERGTAIIGASATELFGSAAPSVAYLTFTRKDGGTLRAAPTAVGPQKFWAVPLTQREQAGSRWTAYDAAGTVVASGPVAT